MKLLSLAALFTTVSSITIRATFDGVSTQGVKGTVTLSQYKGIPMTRIAVDLTGLNYEPDYWHIHVNPVSDGCGPTSTGGHLNPTGIIPLFLNLWVSISIMCV